VLLARHAQRLDSLESRLAALDPKRVLARGYAWLEDGAGSAVQTVRQLAPGQALNAVLADGSARVTVDAVTARPDD
jgi:exodeoxyribonuclease VII large subunit